LIEILGNLVAIDINSFKQPPLATVAILLLSMSLNILISYANRRTVNLDDYRRMMTESAHVRQELMDAMKSNNQRKIARAQKRQQELSQEQMKQSSSRMKTMLIFTIPLLLLWPVLGRFFGSNIVAYMPFEAPWVGTDLYMINWYLLTSIASNIVIQRIMGLTFEIEPKEVSS
jgi:uncharacterized membrane protein (DUF106 family)